MHAVFRSVLWSAFLLTVAIAWTHPALAADVTVTLDAASGFVPRRHFPEQAHLDRRGCRRNCRRN